MEIEPGEFEEENPLEIPAEEMIEGRAPETVNLVESITDEKEQLRIANRVWKDYDRDWRSSERYREKRASILKLFIGMLPPSENDGAQVHYPLVATSVVRIHARVYDQQFPSNGEFFGVRPVDALDQPRAIRVAKHLNWGILHHIPEYVPNHDALIMQWLLYGSAFSYTYWSATLNRPCHEVCRTEDIVLPYKRESTDPNMSDLPRITRVLRLHRHELEAEAETGYYLNVDKLFEKMEAGQGGGGSSGEESQKSGGIQEVTDRAAGVEKDEGEKDDDAPRVLLEQHRWLKLPGGVKQRPVIVTIDRETKILLQVRLREDEDPVDRARYNRERDANEASYAAAIAQYQMNLAAYEMNQPAPMSTPMPMQGEETFTEPPMPGEGTSTFPMEPPPQPPMPPPEPTAPKMVPINFFTHYVCIPNPEGVYGYGIGFLLEGHNMVADTIASQMVDAGTIANGTTFVYSRQAKLGRGELRIKPGQGVQTDLNPQDLDKGFKFLDFKGPNPALANFIRDQQEAATELSGANEILSGEVGGSNETATTTTIRISQALAAISILNKRYTRARTCEGQKFARLYSVYLGDEEYFTTIDPFKKVPPPMPGGEMMQVIDSNIVARRDYLEDTDIMVTADPRMASQPQRVAEALSALETASQIPFLSQNPVLMAALARNYYVALDKPELVAALTMMPMMPIQPAGPPGAEGGPPEEEEGGEKQPRPKPGPSVPNAGPTPANGNMMQGGAG